MNVIDLRSDTVTKPTPEMREAMATAEVGDDVYGDDPTVHRLEALAAQMLRKEASVFVPSGTMGNLIALLVHCQRGDEAIVGSKSHIYLNEAGGMSALGGIQPNPVPNQKDGTLALEDIRAGIRMADVHHPITRLICLENTQNACGGVALTAEYTRQVAEIARQNDLYLHIDGARIFNSAAVQNVDVKDLVAPADSVMFCLSKGLASPVGSMLVGAEKFIARARHLRKMLGGGMRQVGVLAAAGIISLERMTLRVAEDHRRAKALAEGLRGISGIILDENTPHTNMVYFNLANHVALDENDVVKQISKFGILVDWADKRRFRLVTHYEIDDAAVEKTIQAFAQTLG
ncbi:MAG: low-specificity L-threonine aldolase [Anaerolineae bacterium]|nr:MAG: low-specificity L-threonine aldolase [Anaerolineae bacterium]WKZ42825.1 MAG: low-specificity L-threonine aldolase [Anaerolineales bacterium]